ncbi:agamous-like MADS-box protein [Arabidopsis thaliana]|nr:agamous-like MADS-box protein [Arabidopsis thaliana]AEC09980.1 agamous-like MADS-box protein [Arabidopsis thaliana]|eukprot:NP_001118497.1 agamous-like MADS-box protein [Arabidopsis thaliana]
MKLKGRRRDLTKKKVRELCDYCGFSSGIIRYDEQRPHERDHEAVSMENELKRLRLLTRRMTCKDLDGLTFPELLSLKSHLQTALLIVKDQTKKIEQLLKEDDGWMLIRRKDAEDGMGREVSVPCKFSTSSTGERQGDEAPAPPLSQLQLQFERRNAEPMMIEYGRLWLLKERMNGRQLDGMNNAELALLQAKIVHGLQELHEHMYAPTMEKIAKKRRYLLREVPGRS